MKLKYEFYMNGRGCGTQYEYDLTEKDARKKFNILSKRSLCGWAEIIGEDDDNYMEVIDSFDHIKTAKELSNLYSIL